MDVSLSSIKKIEKGEIRSFDSLLRMLRTLGKLANLRLPYSAAMEMFICFSVCKYKMKVIHIDMDQFFA